MKAYIVLKCEGHQLDGFKFCAGVLNTVLDLELLEATSNYVALIKYLDGVAKLFNGPCVSANVISNALYKIYEMGYVNEKTHKYFAYWWDMHKRCGPILELVVKDG